MGVRGLQTFIENYCSEACKYVSIQQLAEEHRHSLNCQPVIVVDGMSLMNRLYDNSSLEWIYGGQWLQFFNELEKFIARFKSIGVKLIFFFDGTVCASKREEWVRRRLNKSKTVESIFSHIKRYKTQPDRKLFQLPTSTGILARFAVKELGTEVYQTEREADDVIAEYAVKHREVFAILSQDSDFIICNTKTYLSLSHLDLNTLHTIHYDRRCFAERYLNLFVEQLPLFACLVGNDIISSEKLRQFHRRISSSKIIHISTIAQNLSKIILTERWTGNINSREELNHISFVVFGHCNDSYLIHDGLKSYLFNCYSPPPTVCIPLSSNMEKSVYERHRYSLNAPYLFNLLCKLEYESSEVLEDASRLPSALAYREIRQRCYGALFNGFSSPNHHERQMHTKPGGSVVVKEWCAYKGNFMKHPELINPLALGIYPFSENKNHILTIEDLWLKGTENEKLQLFWHTLQLPMEFQLLVKLPKDQIVLACVLNYLISGLRLGPLLEPLEVAVFIAQALWKKTTEELKQLMAPPVDSIAVNISSLFMRGVTTVLMVLNVCDFPFPVTHVMPWRFFDGKLFHYLYNQAMQMPSICELCRNHDQTVKDFYNLLSYVINNTVYDFNQFDWKKIFQDFQYPLKQKNIQEVGQFG